MATINKIMKEIQNEIFYWYIMKMQKVGQNFGKFCIVVQKNQVMNTIQSSIEFIEYSLCTVFIASGNSFKFCTLPAGLVFLHYCRPNSIFSLKYTLRSIPQLGLKFKIYCNK